MLWQRVRGGITALTEALTEAVREDSPSKDWKVLWKPLLNRRGAAERGM